MLDRMRCLKVEVEGLTLNVVGGSAVQVGCEVEETRLEAVIGSKSYATKY